MTGVLETVGLFDGLMLGTVLSFGLVLLLRAVNRRS